MLQGHDKGNNYDSNDMPPFFLSVRGEGTTAAPGENGWRCCCFLEERGQVATRKGKERVSLPYLNREDERIGFCCSHEEKNSVVSIGIKLPDVAQQVMLGWIRAEQPQ